MSRPILIGVLILILPVLWIYWDVSNIETRNGERAPCIEHLDIGRLGFQYQDIAEHVSDLTHHQFKLLMMWEDTFVVEYTTDGPNALYFYSRCTDLSPDHSLEKPKANGSCGSNALLRGQIAYIEHHQLANAALEVCGISGEQHFVITARQAVAEQARSLAYGHPEAPRILLRFEQKQHIEVNTFESEKSGAVVAIRWHTAM